jgi:hypothetical protein
LADYAIRIKKIGYLIGQAYPRVVGLPSGLA